jgi:hypothetical protein
MWERYEIGTRGESRVIFQSKFLKQTITHALPVFSVLLLCLPVFSVLLLCLWRSKNICSPPVCTSNNTKIAQLDLRNEENIENCWMISMCLVIGDCNIGQFITLCGNPRQHQSELTHQAFENFHNHRNLWVLFVSCFSESKGNHPMCNFYAM